MCIRTAKSVYAKKTRAHVVARDNQLSLIVKRVQVSGLAPWGDVKQISSFRMLNIVWTSGRFGHLVSGRRGFFEKRRAIFHHMSYYQGG